ncbi:hypothetical protein [Frankia sp. Cppng1_Ct_nod]|uniref:hypothetical protein n=1 Tax=Frankia sp. Cppng1_Ct_nod TaxID=2897162 RepID=UPI0010419A17|nr:hypothetical protein [Frankia sp. Cppng1_Ct_nod]
MSSTAEHLEVARRAVEEARRRIGALHASSGHRLTARIEVAIRRVVEDLDDLAADLVVPVDSVQGGHSPTAAAVGAGHGPPRRRGRIPVPPRQNEPEFHPECDDEGLSGGWQPAARMSNPPRRRRLF